MKIIVGLGNPGTKYKDTYHNMGFKAVEKMAVLLDSKFKTKECKAKTAVAFVGGEKVVLAMPETYMNLSGECVRELLGKYKATAADLVVIYDDIDLPVGRLRLRPEGSGGTHNGMRNIIAEIGSSDFKRIRIGTGDDRGEVPLMDFVLSRVKAEERDALDDAQARAAAAALSYVKDGDFERVMREYNK